MPELEVELDRVATGGAALGLGPDGRVLFAAGGLPGDLARVEVTAEHRRRLEGVVQSVVRPAAGRREPPCPNVAAGCGGCDWQHADARTQRELRRQIVLDCLRRLAKVDEHQVEVGFGPELPEDHYRTTARLAVVDGRAGYRRARSNDVIAVGSCPVVHPLIEELIVDGRFGTASEVTLRVGARTGERLVLATPTAAGVSVPSGVTVVGLDELQQGSEVWYHEQVGEHRLRISARSFFQCRPDGAEALAQVVGELLGDGGGILLDAYGGVGLFGTLLATDHRTVVGVESNASAVGDARVNYPDGSEVVRARFERWRPQPVDLAVADPPRTGLGRAGAKAIAGAGPAVLALVSCDPAALARDVVVLGEQGYALDRVLTVDLFGNTSHVETVSRFERR